ncbi:MAG: hypothetical protein KC713_02230 [Candidatus Omnitrophica bacterium]|nr:hypothetical protein [Candidatus Omnitrophota bacterium]
MYLILIIILVLLIPIIVAFLTLDSLNARSNDPTPKQIVGLLTAVLHGKASDVQFDQFISLSISKSRFLDGIRLRGLKLRENPNFTNGAAEGFIFNEEGLKVITDMIADTERYENEVKLRESIEEESDFFPNIK